MRKQLPGHVTATDLAKMGSCEKQIHLQQLYGERLTRYQEYRRQQGIQAHKVFYQQGQDRRCFIATAIYGANAPQVALLRNFRDKKLMPHTAGRAFVFCYYRISPPIARLLDNHKLMARLVRAILSLLVKAVSK